MAADDGHISSDDEEEQEKSDSDMIDSMHPSAMYRISALGSLEASSSYRSLIPLSQNSQSYVSDDDLENECPMIDHSTIMNKLPETVRHIQSGITFFRNCLNMTSTSSRGAADGTITQRVAKGRKPQRKTVNTIMFLHELIDGALNATSATAAIDVTVITLELIHNALQLSLNCRELWGGARSKPSMTPANLPSKNSLREMLLGPTLGTSDIITWPFPEDVMQLLLDPKKGAKYAISTIAFATSWVSSFGGLKGSASEAYTFWKLHGLVSLTAKLQLPMEYATSQFPTPETRQRAIQCFQMTYVDVFNMLQEPFYSSSLSPRHLIRIALSHATVTVWAAELGRSNMINVYAFVARHRKSTQCALPRSVFSIASGLCNDPQTHREASVSSDLVDRAKNAIRYSVNKYENVVRSNETPLFPLEDQSLFELMIRIKSAGKRNSAQAATVCGAFVPVHRTTGKQKRKRASQQFEFLESVCTPIHVSEWNPRVPQNKLWNPHVGHILQEAWTGCLERHRLDHLVLQKLSQTNDTVEIDRFNAIRKGRYEGSWLRCIVADIIGAAHQSFNGSSRFVSAMPLMRR